MSEVTTTRVGQATRRDHLVGLILCVVYITILVVTSRELAMSRDESFYAIAAQRYAGWYKKLADDPSAAVEQQTIDSAWGYNHEHPALIKTLFAWSFLANEKWHVFDRESTAYRFPGMVLSGLLLWLIYIFGLRAFGRSAGLFAALAFAALPRPFYHAHLDAFDVPITLMVTVVTYAYWRSLYCKRWLFWLGLTYGLALATKHNSWIVPGVLLIHWAYVALLEWRRRRNGEQRRLSLVPWWLVAMAVCGPLIFVGSWPWLWHNTWERFLGYARFHLHHDYYNMEYFGVNYFWPPFPMSYSWVMTAFTVPLTILLLMMVGVGRSVPSMLPRVWASRFWRSDVLGTEDDSRRGVLFLGSMLAPLIVMSIPTTPIFGGTKHWFTAYPFLALFAGAGFEWVRGRCLALTNILRGHRVAAFGLGGLLLGPSLIETAHSHPFGLSHYTALAGGVPGAADYGMNRQFWGFTTGSLVDYFKEQMPNGGTVWICDTTFDAFEMLHRDGVLPRNIRAVGDLTQADYVIVHHEKHFAEVDFQAWMAFRSVTPAHVVTYDGVPIISVYKNPHASARRPR